jgi:hypothetical protein
LIDRQQRWGQWRLYFVTTEGHTAYMPASWTDAGPRDPFIELAQGRAIARVEDLLELVNMTAGAVK